MRLLSSEVLMFIVLAFVACAPAAEEAVVEEPDTTEADIEAVRAQSERLNAAFASGDLDAFMALMAEDAVLMPPNEPSITGRVAVRSLLGGFFDEFIITLDSLVLEEIVVAGDWAFVRDSYATTLTPKVGGGAVQANGKNIWIWNRQADGSWRIARNIWNSDNAPAEQ